MISGGDFANGAIAAAFVHLYNAEGDAWSLISKSQLMLEERLHRLGQYLEDTTTRFVNDVTNYLTENGYVSAGGEACAGPCIGAAAELGFDRTVLTVQSGFGIGVDPNVAVGLSVFQAGHQPLRGGTTTYNYVSADIFVFDIEFSHYAYGGESYMTLDFGIGAPGLMINGGTGLAKWR